MVDIAYTSRVRIERPKAPNRAACLPAEAEPVIHGAGEDHCNLPADAFPAGPCRPGGSTPTGLVGHMTGEIDLEGHVLVIERIHLAHKGLSLSEDRREAVHGMLAVHAEGCPVARSLPSAIETTTSQG